MLEQVESLPGVESAGIIGDLFIGGNPEQIVTTEGDARTISERLRFRRDEVSEGFFKALGTPLLRGRFFSLEDGPDSPRVAIVNDAMARRLWPGHDPVGKRFKLGAGDSGSPWFTVVGVVGDMRRQGLENEPIPQMFEPLAQNPSAARDPSRTNVSGRPAEDGGDGSSCRASGGKACAALWRDDIGKPARRLPHRSVASRPRC